MGREVERGKRRGEERRGNRRVWGGGFTKEQMNI